MTLSSTFLKRTHLLAACAGLFLATGCGNVPNPPHVNKEVKEAGDEDPLYGFNRVMYQFNHALDVVLLKPIAQGYRFIVPEKGREMVSHFVDNIYQPVVFANSVAQADPQNSFATFWRFFLNTSFGVGGLFDVASEAGLKNRTTDFGQTLAIYGINTGPYIVLPVIGPSNGRDAVGRLTDAFINPFNYIDTGVSIALWSTTAVDARSRNMKLIDDIYETSLDPYSTFRSGYTQKRASDIKRAILQRNQSLKDAGLK